MPEWLQNLLTAIGGGGVVLIGVLTVFKKLFLKLFETGIESSFEKSLEKYRNTLFRTTKAYEILLDREMRFYERMDPIVAELVPLEHDLLYCLKKHDDIEHVKLCEKFAEHLKRYGQLCITIKNETLSHQAYVSDDVFHAYVQVSMQMQSDMHHWYAMGKLMAEEKYDEIDYDAIDKMMDVFFDHLACAGLMVRSRLKSLSGDS